MNMEINKAIEILNNERPHCGGKVTYAEGKICEVYSMAMNALEKQIPKKPALDGDGYDEEGLPILNQWLCPRCGTRYDVDYYEYEFCPECGQAIDWSDRDE